MKIVNHIYDKNGNILLEIAPRASGVNHFKMDNWEAGGGPDFTVDGADTNIDMYIFPKGNGKVWLTRPTLDGEYLYDYLGHKVLRLTDGAVGEGNYITLQNMSSGEGAEIFPDGVDTNIDLDLFSKGTGKIGLWDTVNLKSGQIEFPAAQSASVGANTLDDYEEGTWTPGISFGGGTTGITYSIQAGTYTKIGNRVTVTCYIVTSAKGSSTGAALITGLPFTCRNNTGDYASASLYMRYISYANAFMAYVIVNSTTVYLSEVTEAGIRTVLDDTNFVDVSAIVMSVTYQVA